MATKTIPKISIKGKVAEVAATITNLLEAYATAGLAEDLNLAAMFDALQEKNTALITAINRSKRESALAEKDDARDDAARAVVALANGYLHFPDPAVQAAAEVFFSIFDRYGHSMLEESYAIESTLLTSMLQELMEPGMAQKLAKMPGLSQLMVAVLDAQEAFQDELNAYEEEKAAESDLQSASTLKKLILAAANQKLVVYMRAMVVVNEAKYGSFATRLSQLISESNGAVKKRVN